MATPMLDDLKRGYRLGWWALFLRGLVGLAVGVFILARPLDSVAAFALVIAFWAIFNGLTTTVHAFELRPVAPHWWVLLISGLVGVAFGVAALYYYPGLSLTFAVVLVAWCIYRHLPARPDSLTPRDLRLRPHDVHSGGAAHRRMVLDAVRESRERGRTSAFRRRRVRGACWGIHLRRGHGTSLRGSSISWGSGHRVDHYGRVDVPLTRCT